MNYKEAIDFLYASLPMFHRVGKAAYKANLNNTLELDKYFSYPHKKYKTIHVGGTNGKGSVSSLIASVLMEQGYKTGLYTSPHLLDFRERMRVNGEMITEVDVIEFIKSSENIINKLKPSFFELSTAMAFNFFAKENVDVAVIEVGMGGRLDCTNIISSELSVITNIDYDHQEFLGDSIEKIAFEKAGIIKDKSLVIIGEKNEISDNVFIDTAKNRKSKLIFASKHYFITKIVEEIDCYKLNFNNLNYTIDLPLKGKYQLKNIVTAIAAINNLPAALNVDNNSIIKGIKNVKVNSKIRGRWEVLKTNPLVLCDTGHNVHGISEVVRQIESLNYAKLHFVLGMVNDKDIDSVLKILPKNAVYYFTKASVPRAINAYELYEKAKVYSLSGKVIERVDDAVKAALTAADEESLVFIGGSTFVVADALKNFYYIWG